MNKKENKEEVSSKEHKTYHLANSYGNTFIRRIAENDDKCKPTENCKFKKSDIRYRDKGFFTFSGGYAIEELKVLKVT